MPTTHVHVADQAHVEGRFAAPACTRIPSVNELGALQQHMHIIIMDTHYARAGRPARSAVRYRLGTAVRWQLAPHVRDGLPPHSRRARRQPPYMPRRSRAGAAIMSVEYTCLPALARRVLQPRDREGADEPTCETARRGPQQGPRSSVSGGTHANLSRRAQRTNRTPPSPPRSSPFPPSALPTHPGQEQGAGERRGATQRHSQGERRGAAARAAATLSRGPPPAAARALCCAEERGRGAPPAAAALHTAARLRLRAPRLRLLLR
eukprot:scaffold1674_cov340-Prasinococcus_capsulatus_cf.AAC.2